MHRVTINTIAARPWPTGLYTLVVNGTYVLTTAQAKDHTYLADHALRLKNQGYINVGPTTNWAQLPETTEQ